jgi:hypothetical protein
MLLLLSIIQTEYKTKKIWNSIEKVRTASKKTGPTYAGIASHLFLFVLFKVLSAGFANGGNVLSLLGDLGHSLSINTEKKINIWSCGHYSTHLHPDIITNFQANESRSRKLFKIRPCSLIDTTKFNLVNTVPAFSDKPIPMHRIKFT